MEFDQLSGRTLHKPGPWQQILRERQNRKQQAVSPASVRKPTLRGDVKPRLPANDFKIVYRPQAGLRVASWSERQFAQAICQASKLPERTFFSSVIIQTQVTQNLIVASTPDETLALTLCEVTTIQLGATTQELTPYLKPLPGTTRGVITGLDVGTTNEQLQHILATNGPRILHARLLGTSTAAVITFEGTRVPYYIKAYGILTRCRPYRQTIQCCALCGEMGHRQDICPNPEVIICPTCHLRDPPIGHPCTPTCQLCGLNHLTASRECRKKLKPPPPPPRLMPRRNARTNQGPAPANSWPSLDETTQPSPLKKPANKVSWSAVALAPPTAHPSPILTTPTPPTVPDQRIHQLEQENASLKQQLEATNKRTVALESCIEQLRAQVDKLIHNSSHASATPMDTQPDEETTPRALTPAPTDLSRIERLIYDMGEHINGRLNSLDKRLQALEDSTRIIKARKKPKIRQLPPESEDTCSTIPSDQEEYESALDTEQQQPTTSAQATARL